MALPGVGAGPPSPAYDVVIVGAGVQGLALAYELARRGMTRVAVLDRSWPGSGASGRNGELIRSIFSSEQWRGLFEHSRARWAQLPAELDYNLLLNRHGYVVLASTEDQLSACRRDHRLAGLDTELLDAAAARRLLPDANPSLVAGGVLQHDAGFAHHDAVVWAYLRAATRLGVEVFADVTVRQVRRRNGRVEGVQTSAGAVSTPVVVNAAGGDAAELNRLAGVDLPLAQTRLEMLATEPLRPFLRYGLAAPALLGYAHQTARGEFVGGTELSAPDQTSSLNSTYPLLRDMATKWVRLFPLLAGARLLRHWAGTVTQTADLAPVLGELPELSGYLLDCGWVYGFMGAPGAADLLAEQLVTGVTPPALAPFTPQRLRTGALIRETSLVVPGGT